MHDGRLLRQVLRREQLAPGTFHVDLGAKKLYVWLRDSGDPAGADLEASTRTQWLAATPGVSHLCSAGDHLSLRGQPRPARRILGGGASRGWVVEDCVFERANGPGASFAGDGHLIRRCVFQDNGQLGFGAWGCHRTRMEECGIYRNNTKGYSTAGRPAA